MAVLGKFPIMCSKFKHRHFYCNCQVNWEQAVLPWEILCYLQVPVLIQVKSFSDLMSFSYISQCVRRTPFLVSFEEFLFTVILRDTARNKCARGISHFVVASMEKLWNLTSLMETIWCRLQEHTCCWCSPCNSSFRSVTLQCAICFLIRALLSLQWQMSMWGTVIQWFAWWS